jgi:2-oxo-3-hexenedioate decarboxylase/2-keto-4-pentenoate hydratase
MLDPSADLEACVAEIVACRLSGRKLRETLLLPHTTAEFRGYELQRLAAERLARDGLGSVIGYKLGMTSAALQARFGIAEPLYGPIHSGCLVLQDGELACADLQRIGLECEVAVTLGRDLPARGMPYEPADVAPAIASFHAGIEVVVDRFADIQAASPWAIVADGVLHRACALGPGVSQQPDGRLEGELWLGDRLIGTGRVDNLLGGDPLVAVAWLANKLDAHGQQLLRAGQVVFCGSIAPVAWLGGAAARGVLRASLPVLGEATLRLA